MQALLCVENNQMINIQLFVGLVVHYSVPVFISMHLVLQWCITPGSKVISPLLFYVKVTEKQVEALISSYTLCDISSY